MKIILVLALPIVLINCQNSDQDFINKLFTSETPLIDGYEEVTDKPAESIGAIEKCGEGETLGVKVCVPYHNCDGQTNTIIQSGKSDGFGIIDIRFGVNSCDHPLDVCCKIPKDTPSTTESQFSSTSSIPETSTSVPTPSYCGIRHSNGIDFKITGNKKNEAEYAEFPWMVAILKTHYKPSVDPVLAICGGSLIAPNVVLTGAHCVFSREPEDVKIRAGEWDTQTDKERLPNQERNVAKIIIHEEFNSQSLFNDVALLILAEPVYKADNIGTICLPPQNINIESKNCFATGWGKNSFGREGQYQVILKKIELPIVRHDQCQKALRTTRLGTHFILDKTFTCAGGEQGKDTCTGDGGSPLVCPDPNNPNRYIQAGIVAWGIGCGEHKIPGVYGDVSKFRNWIDNHLKRLSLDPSSYTV